MGIGMGMRALCLTRYSQRFTNCYETGPVMAMHMGFLCIGYLD